MVDNTLKIARLGEVLVEEGAITPDMLQAALDEQRQCGCRLGKILAGKGYLNNLALYQAVARHYGLPFADLRLTPPEPSLLAIEDRQLYLDHGFMPWKKEGDTLALAVTDKDILPTITRRYGERTALAITSPGDIDWAIQHFFAKEDDRDARERLWQSSPASSAKTLLQDISPAGAAATFLLFCVLLLFIPHGMLGAFISMNVFYAATLVFKCLLFLVGVRGRQRQPAYPALKEADLPVYTILVPLFQEEAVLAQLVDAIRALDYPKSKLDVKLVVEEGDSKTINAIKALRCERYFDMVPVPYSLPQTKPKACNYALRFAKGRYVTIYDAEDIPDPQQLKKVAAAFAALPEQTACIQARLNYYNRKANLLTRMFALEYGVWFEYLLYGLEALRMPIPLGGTSNHVKREVLERLHAWDPYNVTEDADLGVRLAANGYVTRMVDSCTMEEAPVHPWAWIRQRTRWIKGYMQTYLVHMRDPLELRRILGVRGFFGFQLFIGAPCLIFLISPVIWGIWGFVWCGILPLPLADIPWLAGLMWFNLAFGAVLQIGLALMVAIRQQWWGMLAYSLAYPFYWFLHSFASFRALWQLFTRPFYWEKTRHRGRVIGS